MRTQRPSPEALTQMNMEHLYSEMHKAIQSNNLVMIEFLSDLIQKDIKERCSASLSQGENKIEEPSLLVEACKMGNLEAVKFLLSNPEINPSDNSNRAIIEAAKRGYVEIVKEIMSDSMTQTLILESYSLISRLKSRNSIRRKSKESKSLLFRENSQRIIHSIGVAYSVVS